MDNKELFCRHIEKLELIKDDIHPSDFRFYNIAHFPLLIKNTIENSNTCPTCNENLHPIEEMVNSVPNCFENPAGRKIFEQKKHKIEKHLKSKHRMRFPGYYTSLFSFIGVFISFLVSLLLNQTKGTPFFNEVILTILALGILIGRGIGTLLDKYIFSKNLQL